MTSNPMKQASTKIKSALIRAELLFIFCLSSVDRASADPETS
jgi:hypothetical protein